MNLQQAISRNRIKQSRYRKAEKVLRQIRQRVFDYEDSGKLEKAHRVMGTCKRILQPLWEAQRITAQNAQLQLTPSLFEPGSR